MKNEKVRIVEVKSCLSYFDWDVETTLMYILIKLLTAVHNFLLWWGYYFEMYEELNAESKAKSQHEYFCFLFLNEWGSGVRYMFSHCLAVLKRSKDFT